MSTTHECRKRRQHEHGSRRKGWRLRRRLGPAPTLKSSAPINTNLTEWKAPRRILYGHAVQIHAARLIPPLLQHFGPNRSYTFMANTHPQSRNPGPW